jgi:hypothetical protein
MIDSTVTTYSHLGTATPYLPFSAEIKPVVCSCGGGIDDDEKTLQALKRTMKMRFAIVVLMMIILTVIVMVLENDNPNNVNDRDNTGKAGVCIYSYGCDNDGYKNDEDLQRRRQALLLCLVFSLLEIKRHFLYSQGT